MKRRASQLRATHKARRAALTLRAETRMAAVEAEKGKTKVGSKGPRQIDRESKQAREEIKPQASLPKKNVTCVTLKRGNVMPPV
jgi:hypothetical protein